MSLRTRNGRCGLLTPPYSSFSRCRCLCPVRSQSVIAYDELSGGGCVDVCSKFRGNLGSRTNTSASLPCLPLLACCSKQGSCAGCKQAGKSKQETRNNRNKQSTLSEILNRFAKVKSDNLTASTYHEESGPLRGQDGRARRGKWRQCREERRLDGPRRLLRPRLRAPGHRHLGGTVDHHPARQVLSCSEIQRRGCQNLSNQYASHLLFIFPSIESVQKSQRPLSDNFNLK